MNVIIVEDEKLSAEHLVLLLKKIDDTVEVICYCDTVKATIKAFTEGLQADLLFLDVHLADGNCFDIFSKITTDIPIIFTTAYDNYAIQAFKQNSIDYLLKPIALQDLRYAFEKFKKQQHRLDSHVVKSIKLAFQQLNKPFKTRFLVKSGQTIDTIQTTEIHHFETEASISFLVTTKGSRYAIDYTLDQLEEVLNPADFFRINRKILIHIKAIEKVTTYFNGRLTIAAAFLGNDARIVSRERVNEFKDWLDG